MKTVTNLLSNKNSHVLPISHLFIQDVYLWKGAEKTTEKSNNIFFPAVNSILIKLSSTIHDEMVTEGEDMSVYKDVKLHVCL